MDLFIKSILELFKLKGFKAYVVGGYVRDLLLNKKSFDIDITTDALTDEVIMVMNDYQAIYTNKELGNVKYQINEYYIDITTFRKEYNYKNRKPQNIIFCSNLKDDVIRRDFTINALALDCNRKLFDYLNGLNDLKNQTICIINDPKTRFIEDPLRILRAIRFKYSLNFKIEKNTKEEMFNNKDLLNHLTSYHLKNELFKILSLDNAYEALNEFKELFDVFIDYQNNNIINKYNNYLYKLACINISEDSLLRLDLPKKEISLINYLKIFNNEIDDLNLIKLLSNKKYLLYSLEYLKPLKKDILEFYKLNKNKIISKDDLMINSYEMVKNKKMIKLIQNKILNEIYKGNLNNNNKEDIINYIKKELN